MKIVVTGGAGSGKSTVVRRLQEALGSTVRYANVDDMVRNVWDRPDVLLNSDELGKFRTLVNGKTMDAVREAVFTDKEFKAKIEAIMQRAIRWQIEGIMESEHVVLEFPLLYERFDRELYEKFDEVLMISTGVDNVQERKERLKPRGWNKKTIDGVLASQMTDEERSTFSSALRGKLPKVTIINTSGKPEETLKEVRFFANFAKADRFKQRAETSRVGVVAGSFDPVTRGHMHVVAEAIKLMDYVAIVAANNPNKDQGQFTPLKRLEMLNAAIESLPAEVRFNVFILPMQEQQLMVEWVKEKLGARWLFRGLRDGTDREYEDKLNLLQTKFCPEVSTVYVMTPRELTEVSSSTVRQCIGLKGWERIIQAYTPPQVARYILELYGRNPDEHA